MNVVLRASGDAVVIQPVKFLTPKEIRNIIQEDLNPKKAPGYDLITGRILKEMPRKDIVHLTKICSAIIRMGYFPVQWKVGQIIMIPIMSKIFGKALLKICCIPGCDYKSAGRVVPE
jgi:hypothetical protein